MNFNMSIDEMFRFYALLEKRLELSKSNNERDFIKNQMDTIYGVLSVSLALTVNESLPKMISSIEASKLDRNILGLVVGTERLKSIPENGVIDFTVSEDVTSRDRTMVIVGEADLRDILKPLASHSFAKNIEKAVVIYKDNMMFDGSNVKAWENIKSMFPENDYIYKMWADHITGSIASVGPIYAYKEVKKHVKTWSNDDVAEMLSMLIDESRSEKKEKAANVFVHSLRNTVAYLKDPADHEVVKTLFNLSEKTKEDKKRVGATIVEILKSCDKVAKTRKEYVEKSVYSDERS